MNTLSRKFRQSIWILREKPEDYITIEVGIKEKKWNDSKRVKTNKL